MRIRPFALEHYFARHEFSVPHILCASDCEAFTLADILSMADDECANLWRYLRLNYTESPGHPLLRREISLLYTSTSEDDIIVVTPEEGIFLTMNALLSPGDHVIAPMPAYQSLYEIAHSIGCEISFWQPRKEESWRFYVDDLKELFTEKTRLVVLNFPHNPTGSLITQNEFDEIINVCSQRGITIFSDEMYRFLEYEPLNRLTSIVDREERGIALSGLSKAFGLPGLRIGWLATRNRDLLHRCSLLKNYTTICASAPSEILALIALRSRDELVGRLLSILKSNLKFVTEFSKATSGRIRWFQPRAGSVAFLELLIEDSVEEFCKQLIESKGVLLAPSSLFDFPGNYFRMGFGRKDFRVGLELLQEYLLDRK